MAILCFIRSLLEVSTQSGGAAEAILRMSGQRGSLIASTVLAVRIAVADTQLRRHRSGYKTLPLRQSGISRETAASRQTRSYQKVAKRCGGAAVTTLHMSGQPPLRAGRSAVVALTAQGRLRSPRPR